MAPIEPLSFGARFWMAFVCFWQILFRPAFARALLPAYESRRQLAAGRPTPRPVPPPSPYQGLIDKDGELAGKVTVTKRAQSEPPFKIGGVRTTAAPAEPASAVAGVEAMRPVPVTVAPDMMKVASPPRATISEPTSVDRQHASALWMLSALQREGRFIDFLQENITSFADADVGAAARVVHAGCRKVLSEYFSVEPVLPDAEGARVTVPSGFDADRIRLTGRVAGQPPFAGALKHHGWITRQVRFPTLSQSVDPRVLAPAEVELS